MSTPTTPPANGQGTRASDVTWSTTTPRNGQTYSTPVRPTPARP